MDSEHSWLCIMLTAICFICSCNAITTPLFILNNDKVLPLERFPNMIQYTSKAAFANVIEDMIKLSEFTVVFVEERLSVADVESADALGTPYYYLQQQLLDNRIQYLPAVFNPFDTLSELIPLHRGNVLNLQKNITYVIPPCKHRSLYVFFRDESTERVEVLRDHDRALRDVYFKVRQEVGRPVLVLYTGKSNSEWTTSTYDFPGSTSRPNVIHSFANPVTPPNITSGVDLEDEDDDLEDNVVLIMSGCGPIKLTGS